MISVEKVEIFSPYGQKLTLVVEEPQNGLFVKSLDGLDPTKSQLVTTSFPRLAGEQRQTSRRSARELKIQLGFDTSFAAGSVEKIRRALLAFFMTGMQVRCRYYTGEGLVVDVEGEVEDFDSERMVQEPDATISIFCFDPDFRAVQRTIVPFSSVDGTTASILDYDGSVETGFVLRTTATRAFSEFTLTNTPRDNVSRILSFDSDIRAGDQLEISTRSGNKYAYVYRSGSRLSVLQGISAFSDWVQLYPGENRINLQLEGESVSFELDYTTRYGGI